MRKALSVTAAGMFACTALMLAPAEARTPATPATRVVPLAAPKPDWLSPELEARAHRDAAEGGRGIVAPAAAIADVPASGFVGIRPGSMMVSPSGCTMNFVFRKDGRYAIGTAGHCVDRVGQRVLLLTVAPGAANPVLVDIGRVIFRTAAKASDDPTGAKLTRDFALVRIRRKLKGWVFPTIAEAGGPCGVYKGRGLARVPLIKVFSGQAGAVRPETVTHYGHGLGVGTGGTPRAGVALYWKRRLYYWAGTAAPGDSGSPARVTDLRGAGNLTHLVVNSRYPGANVAGTRLTTMRRLVPKWRLVKSSYC